MEDGEIEGRWLRQEKWGEVYIKLWIGRKIFQLTKYLMHYFSTSTSEILVCAEGGHFEHVM